MTKYSFHTFGFSLIELLIAMLILSIGLVAIVSFQMFIISENQGIQRNIPFQWLLQSVKSSIQLQQWPLMNGSSNCLPENLELRPIKNYCLVEGFPKSLVNLCDNEAEFQGNFRLGVCCLQKSNTSCWIGYQQLEDNKQKIHYELLPLIQ